MRQGERAKKKQTKKKTREKMYFKRPSVPRTVAIVRCKEQQLIMITKGFITLQTSRIGTGRQLVNA